MREGFVHYFDKQFTYDGKTIDRFEQIKEHGILSPRKARELGLPFEQRIRVEIKGVDDYDDIIFLFPIEALKHRFGVPGNSRIKLRADLPIYTPEDMNKKYPGRWVVLAMGEVYTFGRIDQSYFVEE